MTEENNEAKKVEEETRKPEETPKIPSVPLFQIPDAVLNSMSKEVAPDIASLSNPVEWIIKQRKMAEAQVTGTKEGAGEPQVAPTITMPSSAPQKKANVPVVAWAGRDVTDEALVMLFYTVVKEVSKDKRVKKFLKDLKVEIYDANGDLLWP